ncbi:MAG: hypothetical protein V8S34_03430 [Lawsonibacter sp.]
MEESDIRAVLKQWTGVPVTARTRRIERPWPGWRTACAAVCWARTGRWRRWPGPSAAAGWG